GRALADDEDAPQTPGPDTVDERGRDGVVVEGGDQATIPLVDASPQGLAERAGRLAQLLQQEVREEAPVDVPRRDGGMREFALADWQLGPVVGQTADAVDGPRAV